MVEQMTKIAPLSVVKQFYEDLPFNYHESSDCAFEDILKNPLRAYPDICQMMAKGDIRSVFEAGCGVGWFSNAVAYHYGIPAVGIDLSHKAITRAKEVSVKLRTIHNTTFTPCDLYHYPQETTYDLVASIGVLPAVEDPFKGFMHISRFAAAGKYIFLGLYHHYGRKVFREMFDQILEKEGEAAAFDTYKRLHGQLNDEVLLQSWFRDQVIHPSEIWHTLEEVTEWLDAGHFELISTSINRFKPFRNMKSLFKLEKEYETISYQANYREKRFFPGFFTVLARNKSES